MDAKMLEFWGNVFLSAARNQKKIDDLNRIFQQNKGDDAKVSGAVFDNLNRPWAEGVNSAQIINLAGKAADTYKESIKAFLSVFDFVPKEEYLKLVKENEELKDKILDQEKIMAELNDFPGKKNSKRRGAKNDFTKLLEEQTKQFQKVMTQLNLYYSKPQIRNKK